MLKFRAISFPLLLLLLGLMVYWERGGWYIFAAIALLATIGALYEILAIVEHLELPVYKIAGVVLGTIGLLCSTPLLALAGNFARYCNFSMALILGTLAALAMILTARDRKIAIQKSAVTFGAVMLLYVPIVTMISLCFELGMKRFLVFVLITKAGDTGGYIVGMLSNKFLPGGNHKIVPGISPKKSWEGCMGGMIFSLVVAVLFFCCSSPYYQYTDQLWIVLLTGVVLYWGGFAGDLTESCLKRAANVKDSGHLLPGMGGVLDVIDSFLYNAPLAVLALALLR